ncbi:MAG: endonuclease/exonuclease/phosphatase family protein [Actinomycetota bacterium]|nr:endonuclease/exonuclease/phosphatase family protein [Actinomycetota bacterium]
MTYNILRGGQRGAPLDEVVRDVAPDVLLVNEAPKTPFLWRRQTASLAGRWGMRMVAGGRPAGANVILGALHVEVLTTTERVLPAPIGQPRRGVATALLRIGGRDLRVVSTHLPLSPAARLHQTAEVLALATSYDDPVVVAGDLNECPSGACWAMFTRAGFADSADPRWLTFPSDAPSKRIDAVLVRGAHTLYAGRPDLPDDLLARASDHRPVLARLEL